MLDQRNHTHHFVYLRTEQRLATVLEETDEFDDLFDEVVDVQQYWVTEDVFYCQICLRYERVMTSTVSDMPAVIAPSSQTEKPEGGMQKG